MKDNIFYKAIRFIMRERYIKYFLLFAVAFSFFFYLHYSPNFTDPDSFYHVKMTMLMKEQGVIKDFHWLQFTVYYGG